jgi:dephospho-CoA kinase
MTADVPVIGLVGGVGAGKSTVAHCLERLGCAVIDADRIGHHLLEEIEVRDQIVQQWGRDVLDEQGRVDRKALGSIVFSDSQELARLNRIMHPRIAERIASQIALHQRGGLCRAVVLDAAVLFEAGWDRFCDEILFVDAPQDVRMKRVMENRGWDEVAFRARENSQISVDTKADACSYRIHNSTAMPHLEKRVRAILDSITT